MTSKIIDFSDSLQIRQSILQVLVDTIYRLKILYYLYNLYTCMCIDHDIFLAPLHRLEKDWYTSLSYCYTI